LYKTTRRSLRRKRHLLAEKEHTAKTMIIPYEESSRNAKVSSWSHSEDRTPSIGLTSSKERMELLASVTPYAPDARRDGRKRDSKTIIAGKKISTPLAYLAFLLRRPRVGLPPHQFPMLNTDVEVGRSAHMRISSGVSYDSRIRSVSTTSSMVAATEAWLL